MNETSKSGRHPLPRKTPPRSPSIKRFSRFLKMTIWALLATFSAIGCELFDPYGDTDAVIRSRMTELNCAGMAVGIAIAQRRFDDLDIGETSHRLRQLCGERRLSKWLLNEALGAVFQHSINGVIDAVAGSDEHLCVDVNVA